MREVGRGVFLFGSNLGFGFDLEIRLEGVAVLGVGSPPERAGEGFRIVVEGQRNGTDGRGAVRSVGVVEMGVADAHNDVGGAGVIGI